MTDPTAANQKPLIRQGDFVLFQGDSVTNAFRKPEELCNAYQMGMGYALIIAAQLLAERPADGLRFANRGICGEGIKGLQDRWRADCLDLQPDVLSILVGVNNAAATDPEPPMPFDEFEQRYRDLLTETRDALPDVRLVLCEPFALEGAGNVCAEEMPDIIARGEIVRHLADDFGTVLVPLQSVFADALREAPPSYWSYDGIHPNAQGHWLMAQAWLEATGAKTQ